MSIADRPPRTWGRATVAYNADQFTTHVSACRSAEHLAAALAAERGRTLRDSRPDRIEMLSARLAEVTA